VDFPPFIFSPLSLKTTTKQKTKQHRTKNYTLQKTQGAKPMFALQFKILGSQLECNTPTLMRRFF
jgi:hypothetical protein